MNTKKASMVLLYAAGLFCAASAWEIAHPVHSHNTSISESSVSEYMSMSDEQLRSLISTEGTGADGTNREMKNVAYQMGRLYQKTKLLNLLNP